MANVPPDPNSGAAGTELQTVSALRELGCEVDTVWRQDLTHCIAHGNLHNLIELPLAYRQAMLARHRRKPYDVVHANQPHGYLAAKSAARLRDRPIFIHRSHGFEARVAHDLQPWRERFGGDRRSFFRRTLSSVLERAVEHNNRMIARYADGHIVSASQCKQFLVEQYGVDPERVAVIPQAPPADYQTTPVRPMSLERARRILYVGQFAFFKAPMVLARAVERILRAVPEAEFTWVCDRQHHAEALALISDRLLLDRIRLIGPLTQQELMETYDSHGIFLFPSFFEGFGKAFLEAMSRVMVVIASDTGGMADTIKDGVTGFLVPVGDDRLMADRAIGLLKDPDRLQSISLNARMSALDYTWRRTAQQCLEFYRRCAEATEGARKSFVPEQGARDNPPSQRHQGLA